MGRIKVQVPGGNFKSIQTGNTTVTQQIIQSRPTVAAPVPSYYGGGGGGGVTSITGTANEITASASTGDVTLSIASTYAGQTSITTLGTISTGTWEGTAIGVDYGGVPSTEGVDSGWVLTNQSGTPEWEAPSGGGGVTSISGTSNEIDVSASTGAVAISIDSGYLGQTSITTLGTIGTGTWAGTTIAIAHGGTGQTTANAALNALLPAQSSSTIDYILQSDGTNTSWASAGGTGGTTETVLDQTGGASQTYNVPAGTAWLRIICIGGGGGGGGAAKTTSGGTGTGGGGGGASGAMSMIDLAAADAGSALTIVFSNTSGGAAGAGATSAGSGGAGTSGSDVTVEDAGGNTVLFARHGGGGGAGAASSGGTGGAIATNGNVFAGIAGAAGSASGSGNNATALIAIGAYGNTNYGPTSGGGGAGSASLSGNAGGAGGSGAAANAAVTVTGGTAGTAGSGSVDGGGGGTGSSASVLAAAGGGGGGSASGAHNGGNGGPGSGYGAGGGGGGSAYNSSGGNAGSGGAGGYAACIIIAFGAASSSAGANPTASVGLTAVNGSATTFMRSDGAPKLDVSISPTWTGTHNWTQTVAGAISQYLTNSSAGTTSSALWRLRNDTAGHDFQMAITSTGYSGAFLGGTGAPTGEQCCLYTNVGIPLAIGTNGDARIVISAVGAVAIAAPTSTDFTLHALGYNGNWCTVIDGNTTTSGSLGLLIRSGTNSSDYSFYVQDASGTYAYATGRGDGLWSFYEPSFGAAALKKAATYDSGSFTGTLTGMTTTTTGTVYWTRVGPSVTLHASFTGTSNTDAMTMTGLPSALTPAHGQFAACTVYNNSTDCIGAVNVDTLSVLTFYLGGVNGLTFLQLYNNVFTTSGTKGLDNFTVTYSLI